MKFPNSNKPLRILYYIEDSIFLAVQGSQKEMGISKTALFNFYLISLPDPQFLMSTPGDPTLQFTHRSQATPQRKKKKWAYYWNSVNSQEKCFGKSSHFQNSPKRRIHNHLIVINHQHCKNPIYLIPHIMQISILWSLKKEPGKLSELKVINIKKKNEEVIIDKLSLRITMQRWFWLCRRCVVTYKALSVQSATNSSGTELFRKM